MLTFCGEIIGDDDHNNHLEAEERREGRRGEHLAQVMKNSFDFTSALPPAPPARLPRSLYSDNYFIENADLRSENTVRISLCWCSHHIRATPGTPPPRFQLSYYRKKRRKKSHWEFSSRRGRARSPRSSVTNTAARKPVSDPLSIDSWAEKYSHTIAPFLCWRPPKKFNGKWKSCVWWSDQSLSGSAARAGWWGAKCR